MPLVIICGYPCSGKSTRALQLKNYLNESKNASVTVISENDSKYDKNEIYADARKEKEVRAELKSEVQRKLNHNEIVILDAGNYIKGYRYELFCLSKSIKTTQCLVHCDVNVDAASEWNSNREGSISYSQIVFDELVQRFEAPDSQNRWDSPLLTVHAADELPFDTIYEALCVKKALRPNKSTQSLPMSSSNFLHELDRRTQETVAAIVDAQKTAVPGEVVTLPDVSEKLRLVRVLTAAELARLRRQFITYTKMHPVEDSNRITSMFVQYLNTALT